MKHLSTLRKIDYSLSSGERKGSSPNPKGSVASRPMPLGGCKAWQAVLETRRGVTNRTLAEGPWKGPPQGVTVL